MAWKASLNARADREGEKRRETRRRRIIDRRTGATAATTEERLVHAARTGRYAEIVAAAQPAEPPKMVTPEEREAERRATGQWLEDKPAPPPQTEPPAEPAPPAIEPGQPTEPTPGMVWAEEHLGKRPRGPVSRRPKHNPYRYLAEYDVLTGEIIGDGYIHYDEEDERG